MRAAQVVATDGPDGVAVREVTEPDDDPARVLVDVHAVGVSYPDLLLSRGQYQVKPELPFTLGADVAGTVRSAPAGSEFTPGQRVAACPMLGGAADQVAVDPDMVFALADRLSFDQGAALPMNYLTAQFALATRGGLRAGETVLVHGAAGGVGSACVQVAKGYGARVLAVVSTDAKADAATAAGADEAVALDGFRARVSDLTDGRGVDVVIDPVGGDIATDSLRCLAPLGRMVVVGFASGEIPSVRVNRLLFTNTDVRGAGWGGYAEQHPGFCQQQWVALEPMVTDGTVRPPVGATYPLSQTGRALADLAGRRATGKLVLRVRD